MTCPFVQKNNRYQVYATTKATGVQYYRIYANMCSLLKSRNTVMDIISTGSSDSDEASLITNCGGLVPLYKSSTMTPVTVAQIPAGTSLNVVVKTSSAIPQGIILGL